MIHIMAATKKGPFTYLIRGVLTRGSSGLQRSPGLACDQAAELARGLHHREAVDQSPGRSSGNRCVYEYTYIDNVVVYIYIYAYICAHT